MVVKRVVLKKSPRKDKKYRVVLDTGKTVDFGASGYSDFTKHKDPERKKRYIVRHQKNENWGKSGINTAGFWSRWILWNKNTLKDSINDTEKRFGVKVKVQRN